MNTGIVKGTPTERVTGGVPVIDMREATVNDGRIFSLINTITVAQAKVGAIQIYVPGNDYATKTFDMTNASADLTYTAVDYGTEGNSISVTHVDPVGNNQALAVSVAGLDITVSLATDGGGTITSTAAEVKAAVNADAEASALVTCEDEGDGSGVVEALVKASLTGGDTEVFADLLTLEITANGGPATVSLLEDYSFSPAGGDAVVPVNNYRPDATASELLLYGKADVTVAGGAGQKTLAVLPIHAASGGEVKLPGDKFALKTSTNYVVALAHSVAGNCVFGYKVVLGEKELE